MPESKHRRKGKDRPRQRDITPPPSRKRNPSPDWVPRLGVGLLVLGVAVILLGYVPAVASALEGLPGLGGNWTLVAGFLVLLGGFGVLTRWE